MELKDCGLAGILISINPFYLEYVRFERTERGIRGCLPIHEFLKLPEGRVLPATPSSS